MPEDEELLVALKSLVNDANKTPVSSSADASNDADCARRRKLREDALNDGIAIDFRDRA